MISIKLELVLFQSFWKWYLAVGKKSHFEPGDEETLLSENTFILSRQAIYNILCSYLSFGLLRQNIFDSHLVKNCNKPNRIALISLLYAEKWSLWHCNHHHNHTRTLDRLCTSHAILEVKFYCIPHIYASLSIDHGLLDKLFLLFLYLIHTCWRTSSAAGFSGSYVLQHKGRGQVETFFIGRLSTQILFWGFISDLSNTWMLCWFSAWGWTLSYILDTVSIRAKGSSDKWLSQAQAHAQ